MSETAFRLSVCVKSNLFYGSRFYAMHIIASSMTGYDADAVSAIWNNK